MVYDKVVIMQWQNFDKRNSDLFDVPCLLKKGVNVEYWDVSAISIPGYKVHPYKAPEGLAIRTIIDKKQFVSCIKDNKNTAYIVHMTYGEQSYLCFRLLSKYHCTIIYCINGCLPNLKNEYNSRLSYYKSLSIKTIFNLIKSKIAWAIAKSPLIAETDYLLLTCAESKVRKECKVGNKTVCIDYNSCDYQQSLSTNNISGSANETIVFIDQNLPFHPDNKRNGFSMDANIYFLAMNKLFDVVEKKYNKRVVIAAHPSCYNEYVKGNYFKDRQILYNRTIEAVRQSWAVIAHNSTAIAFPVIYRKPIILFTTEEMHSVRKHTCSFCDVYSKMLNCIYVKSENDIIIPDSLNVDVAAYDSFKYQYLTNPKSEGVSNGEILLGILSGHYLKS